MSNIGENVATLRSLQGIKQTIFAKSLGISQQELSKIEQSENIKDNMLSKIAEQLGHTPEFIKNFDKGSLINSFNQTGGTVIGNQFNPLEKIIELYESRVNELLQRLEAQKSKIESLENKIKTKKP
jgi:transcriptional regulator with XRE-family HTH domain